MKKFLFGLMLAVSCVASAAVVPETNVRTQIKVPELRRTNMAKRQAMLAKRESKKKTPVVSEAFVKSNDARILREMYGFMTKENIQSTNNVIRLASENPNALAQQMYGISGDKIDWPQVSPNRVGSNEGARKGTLAPIETEEDPVVAVAQMRMPELSGTYEELEQSREEIAKAHKDALQKIAELGHEHLGQKPVTIYMK